MGGGGYHEPSAQDARRRILAFFDRHLRPAGSDPSPPGAVPGGEGGGSEV
jgi:hypothetical protein